MPFQLGKENGKSDINTGYLTFFAHSDSENLEAFQVAAVIEINGTLCSGCACQVLPQHVQTT